MPSQYSADMLQLLVNDLQAFHEAWPANAVQNTIDGNGITYRIEPFDIIPEVEAMAISLQPTAEVKQVNLHVHVSHEPVMIRADRSFFQPLLYTLLSRILEHSKPGAAVNIHITDSDGRCIVESIHKGAIVRKQASGDYFTKHRITNLLPNAGGQSKEVLAVYRKVVEDMGGELGYAFSKERDNYFRLKFPLA